LNLCTVIIGKQYLKSSSNFHLLCSHLRNQVCLLLYTGNTVSFGTPICIPFICQVNKLTEQKSILLLTALTPLRGAAFVHSRYTCCCCASPPKLPLKPPHLPPLQSLFTKHSNAAFLLSQQELDSLTWKTWELGDFSFSPLQEECRSS